MTLFTLTTAGYLYEKQEAEKLKKLGFDFEKLNDELEEECRFIKKGNSVGLEINTLEDLLSFIKEHGDVIASFYEDTPCIEIYDNYRE